MATTYEPIATTTLGSAAADITFSSISSAYTDLVLILTWTASTTNTIIRCQVNSDTATNYSRIYLSGDGTSATSGATANQAYYNLSAQIGSDTTLPQMLSANFFSYAGSTYKTILSSHAGDKNGSGGVESLVGLWRSTSAINTIKIYAASGNLNTGTTATLYGIKAA